MKNCFSKENVYRFQFLLIIILSICSLNAQEYQVKMAMIGNSITFGSTLSDPSTQTYTAQLSRMLSEIYGDTVLIKNYGISGRTMLKRTNQPIWVEAKFREAIEFSPDICLILLGTNDGNADIWKAYGQDFQQDYLAMIDTFRVRNPHTIFLTCYPPPAFSDNTFNKDSLIIANEIPPIIDTVAAIKGANVIDFYEPFEDSLHLFSDKLHPNFDGHKKMAQILFNHMMYDNTIAAAQNAGLTSVLFFKQIPAIVAVGEKVQLSWNTNAADSVFLDNELVASMGEIEVIAKAEKIYTLTAKGSKNVSTLSLTLNTTTPASTARDFREKKILLYPNPASGFLILKTDDVRLTNLRIEIFDSLGRLVLEKQLNNLIYTPLRVELDISNLNEGHYTYKIYNDSTREFGRFIKYSLYPK